MARDKILLFKGDRENLPNLDYGEMAFTNDDILHIGRLNGTTKSYDIPFYGIENDDNAINQLMRVANSYYANNASLTYGNFHTLFNVDPSIQPGGYEIDCSSFIQACLMGIEYDSSRYLNSKNYQYRTSMLFPDEALDPEEGRTLANDLAEYAKESGWFIELETQDDYDKLKVGDVVFLANRTDDIYFENIGHCQMVSRINQTGTGSITFIEANNIGDVIREITYTRAALDGAKGRFAARFPMKPTNRNMKPLNYNGNEIVNHLLSGGVSLVKEMALTEDLEPFKMYTLFFRMSINDLSTYPIVRNADVDTIYSFGSNASREPGNVYRLNFILQPDDIPATNKDKLRLYINPNSDAILDKAVLYSGYVTEFDNEVEELTV